MGAPGQEYRYLVVTLRVLALSFKLKLLADDLGDDVGGLSATFREQFEADIATYSVLMVFAILSGLLLFVLMAPFEISRTRRQVTHLRQARTCKPHPLLC